MNYSGLKWKRIRVTLNQCEGEFLLSLANAV